MAINGEASLISHTPGRKQAPVQGEEIFVMLLSALGKEAILNDTIVAIVANLCCPFRRSIFTLSLPDNALLSLLSSYVYCKMLRTLKSVSRSEILRDPSQL